MTTAKDGSDQASRLEMRDVNPELYRHPGERTALGKLEKAPGFAKIRDTVTDHGAGKAERLVELASMVRVGTGVYPQLNLLWQKTLSAFGIGDVPLHVSFDQRGWILKGGSAGVRAILSVNLLDVLSPDEMAALLAMIAASIRLDNVNNIAAAEFLRWVQDYYGALGAPAFVLSWAFENWRRHAALSADRAAVLYCGEAPVLSLLDRLAGAGSKSWGGVSDAERIRLQGVEATARDHDWDNSRWKRFIVAMSRSNSGSLVRRLDLAEWIASGAPERIMTGQVTTPEDLAMAGGGGCDAGVAFWGEFAPGAPDAEESTWRETAAEFRDMAEKGVNTFLKAGEAFFRALKDDSNT